MSKLNWNFGGYVLLLVAFGMGSVLAQPAFAANGRDIMYQGTVVDTQGNPVPDGSYDVRIELYPTSVGGGADLSVTVQNVAFQYGTFAAQISDNDLLQAATDAVDSWVQISVDLDNSNTFEAGEVYAPRVPLTSVMRALYAESAGMAEVSVNTQQLGGNPASHYAVAGHTHEAAEITDFLVAVENSDLITFLSAMSHSHSNKANLDTINQNMATTNSVTFNSVSTTASVSAGTTLSSGGSLDVGSIATIGTNLTVNNSAFIGQRLSVGTTASPTAMLYIRGGANELVQGIRMESSATTNTNKAGRIKVGHYDNNQGPVPSLTHVNTLGANTLSLGGGSSIFEPAITDFRVYTGTTTTDYAAPVRFSIDRQGRLATGGETAPDVSAGGITLHQGNADTNIMTFKSSSVQHGLTFDAETDTYGAFKRRGLNDGLQILGVGIATSGVELKGTVGNGSSFSSSGSMGAVSLDGGKGGDGFINRVELDATENILVVRNNLSTRLIVKGNGNVLADGTFTSNGFDMAEYFPAEEDVPPSAVVGLNLETGKVRAYRSGDVFVGIQSQNPAFVGNSPFDVDRSDHALVGLKGQFENVQGAVYEGSIAYTPDMRYRVGYRLANGRVMLDKKEL